MNNLLKLAARLQYPAQSPERVSSADIQRLIHCGLGPLFWHLVENGQIEVPAQDRDSLHAAHMTSVVLTAEWVRSLHRVLDLLQSAGINCLLLKGADAALRYYPQTHWRVMRDLDLLVDPGQATEAKELLIRAGFQNPRAQPDSDWDDHHHLVPLYHPRLKIWIELHVALFPPYSPFGHEAMFDPAACRRTAEYVTVDDRKLAVLDANRSLAFTACHWYGSMFEDYGEPGQQRALVDVHFMMASGQVDEARLRSESGSVVQRALACFSEAARRAGLFELALDDGPPRVQGRWFLNRIMGRHLLAMRSPRRIIARQVMGDGFYLALTSASETGFALQLLRSFVARIFRRDSVQPAGFGPGTAAADTRQP